MLDLNLKYSVYFFYAAAILSIIPYKYFLSRLNRYSENRNNPKTLTVLRDKLPALFWGVLVFFVINNTAYNIKVHDEFHLYLSVGLSVTSVLWGIWTLIHFYPIIVLQNKMLRMTVWGTVSIVLLYDNLAAWQIIPNIWEVSLIFYNFPTWSKLLIYNFLTLYSVILYLSVGHPCLKYITNKTETILDDDLLEIVKIPVIITILLGGIGYSNSILVLSTFAHNTIHAVITSIGIGVWTNAVLRAVSLTLRHFLNSKMNVARSEGNDISNIGFINEETLPAVSILLRIIIIVLATYYILYAWGIDPTAWLASAGIIGIAVAYASQDTLSSLLSGVAILTDSPYKMNDFLILDDGQRGRVESIGFRSTRLMTPEDIQIIIPNSIMANTKIVNISGDGSDYARIDCFAGVGYGSDIDLVRKLLLDVGNTLKYVLKANSDKKPQVHFVSMGASSLDFVLRVWLTDPNMYAHAQDEANTLIYKIFTEHNIEIPYTKQDLYLYPGAPIEVSGVTKQQSTK
jgi:MscS family membrane protein